MSFEEFQRTDWRRGDHPEPQVTITRRCYLSLNQAAMALLGDPKAVEFLFDPTDRIIGLRPADLDGANSYRLSPVGATGRQWQVSGQAFIRYYGLEGERSTRRPANLADGILCVDLKSSGIAVTSNRSKPAPASTEKETDDGDQ